MLHIVHDVISICHTYEHSDFFCDEKMENERLNVEAKGTHIPKN